MALLPPNPTNNPVNLTPHASATRNRVVTPQFYQDDHEDTNADNCNVVTLTPEQEADLSKIPEKSHSRIIKILTTIPPIECYARRGQPNSAIATVDEALHELINEDHFAKHAAPVKQPRGRPRQDGLPAGSVVKKPVSDYALYIRACQDRNDRIRELKSAITAQPPVPAADLVAFKSWADAQRAECERYIASIRPCNPSTVALQADLAIILANIPVRPY